MSKNIHQNIAAILWRSGKNQIGRGSGLLISRNLVLTCAHIFFNKKMRVSNDLFQIYPGLCGRLERAYKIEGCFIPEEYERSPNNRTTEFDYALVKLSEMVPASNFLPLSGNLNDEAQKIAIYGYPEKAYTNLGG